MSGRRSRSCDGTPNGIAGGGVFSGSTGIENSDAGLPTKTAIACSNWDWCNANAGCLRLRLCSESFGLSHGLVRIDAGFVKSLRKLQRFLIGDNGTVQNCCSESCVRSEK